MVPRINEILDFPGVVVMEGVVFIVRVLYTIFSRNCLGLPVVRGAAQDCSCEDEADSYSCVGVISEKQIAHCTLLAAMT